MQNVERVMRVLGSANGEFACRGSCSGVNDGGASRGEVNGGGGSCSAPAAPVQHGWRPSIAGARPPETDSQIHDWDFVEAVAALLLPLARPVEDALMAEGERVAAEIEHPLLRAAWMTVAHGMRRQWSVDDVCLWRGRVMSGAPLFTMSLVFNNGVRILQDGKGPCVTCKLTGVRAAVILAGLVDLLLRLADGWSAAPLRRELLEVHAHLANVIYVRSTMGG